MIDEQDQKIEIANNVAQKKLFQRVLGNFNIFKKKKKTASMESTQSKSKNLITFMLELLGALKGKISKVKKKIAEGKKKRKKKIETIKSAMPPIVLTLLTNVLARLLPTMQQKVLDLLMKYLNDNCALDTVNLSLPIGLVNGMKISATNLDIFRILKEDFNSKTGQIFFGNPACFAAALRTAALYPGQPTTPYNIVGNAGLDIEYIEAEDKFKIQANQGIKDINLKDFINAMLKKVIPFTPKVFIGLAADKLYGVLSNKIDQGTSAIVNSFTQGRSADDITNDEYIMTVIENYLEYDLDDVVETATFYTFTDEQKGLIEKNINSRLNGAGSFEADCGEVFASLPPQAFLDIMDLFTGATKSTETKIVGQVLNGIGDQVTSNLGSEDKDTGKKGFFSKLIKLFPAITTKMFLSPDVVFLMEVAKMIKQQTIPTPSGIVEIPEVKSGKEFLRKNSQILREISKEFYGEIMKELFKIVKEEIIKLLLAELKAKVVEKLKAYTRVIISIGENAAQKAAASNPGAKAALAAKNMLT